MAVADFNGDGVLDLAVANTVGNNIAVLLGNGSGEFTRSAASPVADAGGPIALAAGDWNGDGIPDLAIAHLNGDSVSVMLGDGSGGFTAVPGSPFAAGTNPDFVAVGDFNGDGAEDLAVSNLNSNSVTVLLGNGSGGFAQPAGGPFPVGGNPQCVVVEDFNGDGILDLATADYAGTITLLLGNGAGGFSEASGSPLHVDGTPAFLAVGDFNSDAIPDLAVSSYNTGTVAVLLGDGKGGFAPAGGSPFAVGTGRGAFAVADFNGDAFQDLAVANGSSDNVTILLGDGTGGFTAEARGPFAAGIEPVFVAPGDFNGDNIEDLVIANLTGSTLTVLLGAH